MNKLKKMVILLCGVGFLYNANAAANDELKGDAKTACEVILCLSSSVGSGIAECKPPIRKFFSIKASEPWKTIQKRANFLKLCPAADENAAMKALTTAVANQEYACDADTLNSKMETKGQRVNGELVDFVRVKRELPSFCRELYSNELTEYTDINQPKNSCSDQWYPAEVWKTGYYNKVVGKKWNNRGDNYTYTYKKEPINKNCWSQ